MRKHYIYSVCLAAALLTHAIGSAAEKIKQTQATTSPTTCIKGTFSSAGDQYFKTVNIQITNDCTTEQDFQNATITFSTPAELNTTFWGSFSPLSYPDGVLQITTIKEDDAYLASLNLHFPTTYGTTKLPPKGSFQMTYGTSNNAVGVDGTVQVYVQSALSESGTITISNQNAQPQGTSNNYATVHVILNGQAYSDLQVPWSSAASLTGVPPAAYTLMPENVTDSSGNIYQASVTPSTVQVTNNGTATSTLTYVKSQQNSQITINMPPTPELLKDYSTAPSVSLTDASSTPPSVTTVTANWGGATLVKSLKTGTTYTFSSPTIVYNGSSCIPSFQPTTITTSSDTSVSQSTTVLYECTPAKQDMVTLSVTGAGTQSTPLNVTLTPYGGDSSTATVQSISLTNGAGSATFALLDGMTYTIEPDAIQGYTFSIDPHPFTVSSSNSLATITYSTFDASFPYGAAPSGNVCQMGEGAYATPETVLGSWAMKMALDMDVQSGVLPSGFDATNTVYAVGTAAVGNALGIANCGGGCNDLNGYCFAMKFNTKTDNYPYMIFQSVNIGANTNSFDVYLPGGGSGAWAGLCTKFWGTNSDVNWELHMLDFFRDYGDQDCDNYFKGYSSFNSTYKVTYNGKTYNAVDTLRDACVFDIKTGFMNYNYESVTFVPVMCPTTLTQITGIKIDPTIKTIGNQDIIELKDLSDDVFQKTAQAHKENVVTITQMEDCKTPSSGYCNNNSHTVTNYQASISASLTGPVLDGSVSPDNPTTTTFCSSHPSGSGFCSWDNGQTGPDAWCNGNGTNTSDNCFNSCGGGKYCTCDDKGNATCVSAP